MVVGRPLLPVGRILIALGLFSIGMGVVYIVPHTIVVACASGGGCMGITPIFTLASLAGVILIAVGSVLFLLIKKRFF